MVGRRNGRWYKRVERRESNDEGTRKDGGGGTERLKRKEREKIARAIFI